MLGLVQPIMGFNMKVTSHVNYSVLEAQSGVSYFLTTVTAPYTAKVGDALAGIKRLRLANDGSIRTNIQTFINEFLAHNPS